MDKLLLDVGEVASALGLSRQVVYRLIWAKRLPALKVGGSVRVPVAALQDWIARRVEGGQEVAAK